MAQDRAPKPAAPTTERASADPVTAAQARAGRIDPSATVREDAMGEGVGVHDGSPDAGQPGFSTSMESGADVVTDVSEGRASGREDVDGPRPWWRPDD